MVCLRKAMILENKKIGSLGYWSLTFSEKEMIAPRQAWELDFPENSTCPSALTLLSYGSPAEEQRQSLVILKAFWVVSSVLRGPSGRLRF